MKQKKIKFYSKSHVYKLGRTKLTSVTQFIHKFFHLFNAKEIARKLAKFPQNKKAKKGVRYWLNEWKKSADHGTRVHMHLENFVMLNKIPDNFEEDRDSKKVLQGMTWYDKWNENIWTYKQEAEKIIFSEELGLAGTIDLYAETLDGVTLIDWKSNKKITTKGYNGKKGLEPIEELEDCHLVKYTLQLSLYAYILEKYYGKKIHELIIVHLEEEKHKEYIVPYEKETIKRLLEYGKETK